jgi:hypothetical protein
VFSYRISLSSLISVTPESNSDHKDLVNALSKLEAMVCPSLRSDSPTPAEAKAKLAELQSLPQINGSLQLVVPNRFIIRRGHSLSLLYVPQPLIRVTLV